MILNHPPEVTDSDCPLVQSPVCMHVAGNSAEFPEIGQSGAILFLFGHFKIYAWNFIGFIGLLRNILETK